MAVAKPLHDLLNGQYHFGRLTVVSEGPRDKNRRQVICKCSCGTTVCLDIYNIKRGLIKSCGCFRREFRRHNQTHGRGGTPEHNAWKRIVQRTTNPRNPSFPDYGGRGITMCDEWKNSFATFLHDMGERPSPKHSIDRIDVNGNYEPNNCRWATHQQQANNRRTNRHVFYKGVKMTVSDAARAAGLKPQVVRDRIRRGWPRERWFIPKHERYSQ